MRRRLYTLVFLCIVSLLKSQVSSGPLVRYTFNDGTIREEIRNLPVKAPGVSLVTDRFGNPRSAAGLPGNYNSYLNLGTNPLLKPASITISFWVYLDEVSYHGRGVSFNPLILTKSHGGDDFFEGYFIGYEYSVRKFAVGSTCDSVISTNINAADTGSLLRWYHIVLSFNDQFMWFYINGVMQNEGRPMAKNFRTCYLATDSVILGSTANKKNMRSLSGVLDDIYIYDRVLSAAEVAELYNAPNPDKEQVYASWFYRTLAALALGLMAVGFVILRYRKKLEKEREQHKINSRLVELETKAIRTQMNPHFMFNSLNTLQHFILDENTPAAHLYLAKFSKLLRKILEGSVAETISLSEEIDILEGYIEIEKLRFGHSFEYRLESDILNPEHCFIPFMLIQPFVENAIWHGLLPKENERAISIHFLGHGEKSIQCVIDDNGIGRKAAGLLRSPIKKRSLAMELIRQRLELLGKAMGTKYGFTIIDKENENAQSLGTTIKIIIPIMN